MLINLRDIDMPISNIKEYSLYIKGDETIPERRELMFRYKEYVKKKVQDTLKNLEMTTKKLRQYDSAVADILEDENIFQINNKFNHSAKNSLIKRCNLSKKLIIGGVVCLAATE